MPDSTEKLIPANITDVMQRSYIDYSMSVIVSRALPDVRDGLKPVQRRVLYAMLREGLVSSRPFDKCAGVVGEVLKNLPSARRFFCLRYPCPPRTKLGNAISAYHATGKFRFDRR